MTDAPELEELSKNEPAHIKHWRQLQYDLGMSVPYGWVAPVPYKKYEEVMKEVTRDGGA